LSLSEFISSNYLKACEMQRGIHKDEKMKKMILDGTKDNALLLSWMRDYGLFQGINSESRTAIVNRYFSLVSSFNVLSNGHERRQIEDGFRLLLTEFYNTVNRKWLSAASKLLWCSYPDNVVIYDSFVERALIVLQGLESYLANFPRIKSSPQIKEEANIENALQFYMNYQDMVVAIHQRYDSDLQALRKRHSESYPHDIRIVDKLLWMLGNPNQGFSVGGVQCVIA